MKISVPNRSPNSVLRLISAALLATMCAAVSATQAATSAPVLISDAASTRAIAVESVTLKDGPFAVTSTVKFSNDTRTRIALFAMNMNLLPGETTNGNPTSFTADAEDVAHNHYPLNVEYVNQVPGFPGIYMIIVRLSDNMPNNLGDVLVSLSLHAATSNRVRVGIGVAGGGPADDPGSVPTPAPASPPTPNAPVTTAEYQALFNSPFLAAGPDGLRFLEQATWGPTDADLAHVRSIGMLPYLNEQFNMPPQFVDGAAVPPLSSDYPATPLYPINQPSPCDANCVRDNYTLYPLQKQFMTNALTQPDQVRQRVAFALHQFIVVGGAQLNNNEASWYAPYLQTIDRNAFGNFRTLLLDMTLNPGMGQYLDMRGNSAANGTPNENYAREIMQLFSIGVDTLNQDGTPVLDAQGNRVPSYSQDTISNLARIFTGWDLGPNKSTVINGVATPVTNYLDPMPLNANTNRYDLGQKTLFGTNFPACTTSSPPCTSAAQRQAYKTAELNTAIDLLFNHANTGPYLCTQLIRNLVTSNPSAPYVGRCAAVFANNGSGTRGDLKAVVTEILLDPEARGDAKSEPNYGHLREPVLLLTHLLRTLNATSDGVLVTNVAGAGSFTIPMNQNVFNPPTVFSYYPADYGLPGTSLIGPEFGILDTSTTYARTNFMNTLLLGNSGNGIAASPPNRPTGTQLNYSSYQAILTDPGGTPQKLVDALNVRLMHGTMSATMNANIVATLNAIASSDPAGRTRTAIYLVATSAQYQVER
ncbi:MAG: DUF1800 family protein [Acidobacteriota bacterium]